LIFNVSTKKNIYIIIPCDITFGVSQISIKISGYRVAYNYAQLALFIPLFTFVPTVTVIEHLTRWSA